MNGDLEELFQEVLTKPPKVLFEEIQGFLILVEDVYQKSNSADEKAICINIMNEASAIPGFSAWIWSEHE
jgi:hypothetical protein